MSKERQSIFDTPLGVLFGSPPSERTIIKIIEPFDIGVLCLFVEWLFYFEDYQ